MQEFLHTFFAENTLGVQLLVYLEFTIDLLHRLQSLSSSAPSPCSCILLRGARRAPRSGAAVPSSPARSRSAAENLQQRASCHRPARLSASCPRGMADGRAEPGLAPQTASVASHRAKPVPRPPPRALSVGRGALSVDPGADLLHHVSRHLGVLGRRQPASRSGNELWNAHQLESAASLSNVARSCATLPRRACSAALAGSRAPSMSTTSVPASPTACEKREI